MAAHLAITPAGQWADVDSDVECDSHPIPEHWLVSGDHAALGEPTCCGEETIIFGCMGDLHVHDEACEAYGDSSNTQAALPTSSETHLQAVESQEQDGDDETDADAGSESDQYWVNGWMVAHEDPELVDHLFVAKYDLSKAEYWPVFPIAEDPVAEAISHADSDEGSPAAEPIIFGSFDETLADAVDTQTPLPDSLRLGEHTVFGQPRADAEAEIEAATLATVPLTDLTTENAGNDTEAQMTAPDPVEHVTAAEAPISCIMEWDAYKEQRLAMRQMIGAKRAAGLLEDLEEQRHAMAESMGFGKPEDPHWIFTCTFGALEAVSKWCATK